MEATKRRYPLIDAIRGLSVVNMVCFHFLYDYFMVWGVDADWYYQPLVHLWQRCICRTFIFLAGFVWRWGRRSNLRRGVMLNLWGGVISIVMLLAVPDEPVWFGILSFLGCALLLMELLEKPLSRLPAPAGLGLSLFLYVLTAELPHGYLSLGPLWRCALPQALYEAKVLILFGFQFPGFYSSDYFPIFPWLFLFLCGYFAFRIFEKHPAWQRAAEADVPLLSAVGRRSLAVYLIHQPVCYVVSMVLVGMGM